MICPQCNQKMEAVHYDIGFGIKVKSFSCVKCKFNSTKEEDLEKAMAKLREKTAIETKVIRVGSGVGFRVPNEIAKNLKLRLGQKVELIQQVGQLLVKKETKT